MRALRCAGTGGAAGSDVRTNARRRGFTLLEVILALGMMSVLALTLYQSLRVAFRARETAVSAVGPARAAHLAVDLVRRDFEGTLPPKGLFAGPMIGYSANDGGDETDSVEFYSVGADPGRYNELEDASLSGRYSASVPINEGIRKVQLGVEVLPDEEEKALVRRVTTNLLSPTEIEPEPEILCRGVRSFSLRYFTGETWEEEYDSTLWGDVLPVAIEMVLEIDLPADRNRGESERKPYKVVKVFRLPCREEPADTTGTGLLGG